MKTNRIYYYHIDDLGILYTYITEKNKKFYGSSSENVFIKDHQGYGLSECDPDRSISSYPKTFETLKKYLVKEHESLVAHWKQEFIKNKIQFGASLEEKLEHKDFIKKELEYVKNLKNAKNYSEIDKVYNEWNFDEEHIENLKEEYGEDCFKIRSQFKSKESKIEINNAPH